MDNNRVNCMGALLFILIEIIFNINILPICQQLLSTQGCHEETYCLGKLLILGLHLVWESERGGVGWE